MKIENLKTRENIYGYDEFECPLCGEWHSLKSVSQHISRRAYWEKRRGKKNGKHLKFWLENSEIVKVRQWKNNVIGL